MAGTTYLLLLTVLCTLIYFFPRNIHPYFLLAASIGFFLCIMPSALLYLGGVIAMSYPAGRILAHRKSRFLLGSVIVLIVLLLAGIKYSGLWLSHSIAIPLGLSYYSLMVIGYLVDVYRGSQKAERNLVRYALYVSFFPQITAGPVGRFGKLSKQFKNGVTFDGIKIRTGFLMVMLGLFEKIFVADNLLQQVNEICNSSFTGFPVFYAMLLYSLVIYFDFAGYSLIAIGAARILGIRLMANFEAPYTAVSVQDFWRRWHISLSSWFRDYVYIPLGGSRKGTLRRDINTMIIFLLSGAWHGAMAGYILWGGIHGIYLMAGKHTKNIREKITKNFSESRLYRNFRRLVVYLLVSFAWIPFYEEKLWKTRELLMRMFTLPAGSTSVTEETDVSVTIPVMVLFLACGAVAIFLDRYIQNGRFVEIVAKRHTAIRYAVYLLLFLLILFPGVYGFGYNQADFIYGQF